MKDVYEKIRKWSYISFCLSYCMYIQDITLIHQLINEITQLGIITLYKVTCSQCACKGHNMLDTSVQNCRFTFVLQRTLPIQGREISAKIHQMTCGLVTSRASSQVEKTIVFVLTREHATSQATMTVSQIQDRSVR